MGITGSAIGASGSTLAQEEQRGKEIAESVRAGENRCADLSVNEFESIGEYAMGSYLGSEAGHSAMNRRMTLMMGGAGERRMHIALGYRYSSCAGGPATSWVGAMAGMMGGRGAGGNRPGMMAAGEYEERGSYSGTMMSSSGHRDSGISTPGIVLIALAAAAIGVGVGAVFARRAARG